MLSQAFTEPIQLCVNPDKNSLLKSTIKHYTKKKKKLNPMDQKIIYGLVPRNPDKLIVINNKIKRTGTITSQRQEAQFVQGYNSDIFADGLSQTNSDQSSVLTFKVNPQLKMARIENSFDSEFPIVDPIKY